MIHTYWILISKFEVQSEGLVQVERVVVQHLDVQGPVLEVVGRDQSDACRKRSLNLDPGKLHVSLPVLLLRCCATMRKQDTPAI